VQRRGRSDAHAGLATKLRATSEILKHPLDVELDGLDGQKGLDGLDGLNVELDARCSFFSQPHTSARSLNQQTFASRHQTPCAQNIVADSSDCCQTRITDKHKGILCNNTDIANCACICLCVSVSACVRVCVCVRARACMSRATIVAKKYMGA
jgi:hypothetical protein